MENVAKKNDLTESKNFHQVDWDVSERFFFMPRFVRDLSENGKEILSMNEVVSYFVKSYQPVIEEMDLLQVLNDRHGF